MAYPPVAPTNVPATAAAPVPAPSPADDPGESALVKQYENELKIPTSLEKWYRAFDIDRTYVNDRCMLLDAEDAVGTNHILRNQHILMSKLNSRKADIAVVLTDAMWPDLPQIDPMTLQPSGQTLPGGPPPELEKFARTSEILARKLLIEARFRQQLAGAIQDVETNAIVFVLVNQQQDLMRDPVGNYRMDDQQDNFALYRFWQGKITAGEVLEGSAEMARFKHLEDTVRTYLTAQIQADIAANPYQPPAQVDAAGQPMPMDPGMPPPVDPRQVQMQGLQDGTAPIDPSQVPEVASWIGFPVDILMPEDVRYSWQITRPEDFFRMPRVYYRVFMDENDFGAKFALAPEAMKAVPRVSTANASSVQGSGDPTDRDDNALKDSISKQIEVWTCWDRQTNKVNVFVKGYCKFLSSQTPTAVWRHWCPILPFLFNRATGRLVGISSTTLQRPAQEEINTLRTHDRHARKASFPRLLVKKGVFLRGEKEKYKRALPYEVIELFNVEDIAKMIQETRPVPYDPRLTDTSRAELDLQKMAGVSVADAGAVGASDTATEAAIAHQGLDVQVDFKRGIIEDLYCDVTTCILDMAMTVLPEENVKALVGPGAVWPQLDRQTMWRSMAVEVRAGSTGKPDVDKRMSWATNTVQLARGLGLSANGPAVLDELTRDSGIFTNLSKFFQLAPPPMPGAPGGGGPPGGSSGGPPPVPPSLDSQQGAGGGNPTLPGEKPIPGPEQIPNHPRI